MKRVILLISVSALILTSCATTKVIDTWKDESQTEKFTKVFVLAVVKEPAYRSTVERKLVNVIKGFGVDAQATYDLFPETEMIDKAAAAAAIRDNGVDGVMVVRPVDRTKETVYTPGSAYIVGGYGGGWYGYYGGGYRVITTPGYTTKYYITTVESAMFSTGSDKQVWSTLTQTEETTIAEAIDSYIKTIGRSLKGSGLF